MTYPPEALATNYKFHLPTYEMTFMEVKQDMVLETTAYWYMDPVDASGTGITCTGHKCVPYKTLAVDPKVIPFGSKVYFHSTGETYIADDSGSAIKGYKADKAMDSKQAALNYGRRTEKVTVTFPESKPIFIEK